MSDGTIFEVGKEYVRKGRREARIRVTAVGESKVLIQWVNPECSMPPSTEYVMARRDSKDWEEHVPEPPKPSAGICTSKGAGMGTEEKAMHRIHVTRVQRETIEVARGAESLRIAALALRQMGYEIKSVDGRAAAGCCEKCGLPILQGDHCYMWHDVPVYCLDCGKAKRWGHRGEA